MTYEIKTLTVYAAVFLGFIFIGLGFWFFGNLDPVERTVLVIAGAGVVSCFVMTLVVLAAVAARQKNSH